ncbi:MAG: ABC transporter permease [Bacteroidota bacterium]
MFRYLGKRLLILIPSLWLILSIVFVLNKTALTQTASSFYSQESKTGYQSGQEEGKERAFQQYLHRTGQDLPLFYFSLHSLAEPDTLSRITAPRDFAFLKKMLLTYGNWPEIRRYYQSLLRFENKVSRVSNVAVRNKLQRAVDGLFVNTDPSQTKLYLRKCCTFLHVAQAKCPLEEQLNAVIDKAQPWRSFVPALHWNGVQTQYHHWFTQLLQADLGLSLRDSRPVAGIIGEALGNTLMMVLATTAFTFLLATLLGIWLSHPAHFRWRKPILSFLYLLDTIPLFILALVLLLVLSGSGMMGIFPVYGLENTAHDDGFFARIFSQLYHLTIPVFCLTLANLPYLSNQVYRALQQVESQEYIQTARAKGLSEYTVIGKHALRNALLPLITLFTGFIPAFIGGALITEVIFAIPGMGRLLADSVLARDNPVVLGIVLCLALAKMLFMLLADGLYYLADPRIRFR